MFWLNNFRGDRKNYFNEMLTFGAIEKEKMYGQKALIYNGIPR